MTDMQPISSVEQSLRGSEETGQEFEQRREQFLGFIRWLGWADLLAAGVVVVAAFVTGEHPFFIVALIAALLYPVTLLARRLAQTGRLILSIYVLVGALYALYLTVVLTTVGTLPVLILASIMPSLVMGLFVSAQRVLRMVVVTAVMVALWMVLDRWPPFVRIDVSVLPLFIAPPVVLLVGYLIHLFGQSLNQALAASESRAAELERSQSELARRSRELQAAVSDLSYRSQELEVANVQLTEARRRQEAINRELQAANERTRRRAAQLQAVAEVGQAVARLRDLDRLLPQVTEFVSRHFGFYHVGIFLVDQAGRYAVLRAANSEGGRRMLARNHKLAVGKQGIVGYVAAAGEPRVALSARDDSAHLVNPDLPSTLSEMALPLQIGGQTVGVLDVQSLEAEAFDQEDMAVLSTLADQVSVAIETARLFEQSREALAEAEETQRRYLGQAWQGFLQQRPTTRFEYRLAGVPSALDVELPTTQQAMARGEPVAVSEMATEGNGNAVAQAALSVPIRLRGQVIGAIDLHEADEARVWTEDEIALTQAVADQMAQAVETARLFEQTQSRARREALTRQITERIRDAMDVDAMLQTAVQELGRALGAPRVYVRLTTDDKNDDTENGTLPSAITSA